jgi:hypothetical protein
MWEGKEKTLLLHPHWIFFLSFLTHPFTPSFLPQSREQKNVGIYFISSILTETHTYILSYPHACVTFQSYELPT